eukprot:9915205-Ditylum_brightwellii.AAC.1
MEDPSTATNTELNSFFDDLKEANDKIVVPTNKTNAHPLEATKYAESLQGILSTGEYDYLMEGLGSKAIPDPQLLIKDHKDKVDNKFPMRL